MEGGDSGGGGGGGGGSVVFGPRAYAKIILHTAKYPHCAVNGNITIFINKITLIKDSMGF